MNRRSLIIGAGVAAASGLAPLASAVAASVQAAPDARTAARDAWLYSLPLIEMATTRKRHLSGGQGQNRFNHARALIDHHGVGVTTPNNDTLYSIAWLDLTAGPVTLAIPPMGERYYSAALMDMYTNNNAVLGGRTIGGQGGRFTIVGPGQAGGGPGVVRAATAHAWLLVRIVVDGPQDLDAVHRLQDGFVLKGPAGTPPAAFAERNAAPADYFDSARRLLAADPPPATDAAVLRSTAALLGAGAGAPPAEAAAGVADAKALLDMLTSRTGFIQGWSYPRADLGDYGQDYIYRAAVALAGLGALPRAEAMYLRAAGDDDTGVFNGDGLYRLSLPARMPLDAFWSLSMYERTADGQFFFTDNPLHRYAIGDRTQGLKRNADGSVDLWIGRGDPGGERTANWLPAPKAGPFGLFLRCYLPRPELLDGRWRAPAVVKA